MKNKILYLSATFLITLSSCRKDYLCSCGLETSTGGYMSTSTPIFDVRYDEAKETCDQISADGGSNCSLAEIQ